MLKEIVEKIFDLGKERNVDLHVAAVMLHSESGVETEEASKFIHENYKELCAARNAGDTEAWDALFEAEPEVGEDTEDAEPEAEVDDEPVIPELDE